LSESVLIQLEAQLAPSQQDQLDLRRLHFHSRRAGVSIGG
jgi:hypothetical protein